MGFWDFFSNNNEPVAEQPKGRFRFNGSQEDYKRQWEQYMYIDEDPAKAADFETFVSEMYPNQEFCDDEYGTCMRATALADGDKLIQMGFAKSFAEIMTHYDEEIIDNACQELGYAVAFGYLNTVMGYAHYNTLKFVYYYVNDLNKVNKLAEQAENASGNRLERLEKQIESLNAKYNGWLGLGCYYVHSVVENSEIDKIAYKMTNNASDFSCWLDEIYATFLNNAIQIHGADNLAALFPTEAQRNNIREMIRTETLRCMQGSIGNMQSLSRRMNTCINTSNRMRSLVESNNDDKLLGQGALSLALGFISPIAGIANGLRAGYNAYSAEQEVDRIAQQLDGEFQMFWGEYLELCCNMINATINLADIYGKIGLRYLAPALKDVITKVERQYGGVRALDTYL